MLFDNTNKQNKYYQVWKDIFKIVNGGNGELVFKIHSIAVVIKSLIEKNNKFYLELSLNHCLYKL